MGALLWACAQHVQDKLMEVRFISFELQGLDGTHMPRGGAPCISAVGGCTSMGQRLPLHPAGAAS